MVKVISGLIVTVLFLSLNCKVQAQSAPDTLRFYNQDTLLAKVVKVDQRTISLNVGGKSMKVAVSEVESIHYSDGTVTYLISKNFKYIEKLKKGNKSRKIITLYPAGLMFNNVSAGFEYMNKNRGVHVTRAGLFLPIFLNSETMENVHGGFMEYGYKKIFTEPLRISGLSVRPLWQGFFWEVSTSVAYLDFHYLTGSNLSLNKQSFKAHAWIPSAHFSFGYSTMLVPKLLIGFGVGVGVSVGNIVMDDPNSLIKPSFNKEHIGLQKYISHPVSIKSFLQIAYVF